MNEPLVIVFSGLLAALWGGSPAKPTASMEIVGVNPRYSTQLQLPDHKMLLQIPHALVESATSGPSYTTYGLDTWDLDGYSVSFEPTGGTVDENDVTASYVKGDIGPCPNGDNLFDFRWVLDLTALSDQIDATKKPHRAAKTFAEPSPVLSKVVLGTGAVVPVVWPGMPVWSFKLKSNELMQQAAAVGMMYISKTTPPGWTFELAPLNANSNLSKTVIRMKVGAEGQFVFISNGEVTPEPSGAGTPHLTAFYDLLERPIPIGNRVTGLPVKMCGALKPTQQLQTLFDAPLSMHILTILFPIHCPPPQVAY